MTDGKSFDQKLMALCTEEMGRCSGDPYALALMAELLSRHLAIAIAFGTAGDRAKMIPAIEGTCAHIYDQATRAAELNREASKR